MLKYSKYDVVNRSINFIRLMHKFVWKMNNSESLTRQKNDDEQII